MDLFEILKRNWRLMGIFKCDTKRDQILSITLKSVCLTIMISFTSSISWFLVFDAQTPRQHLECSYYILASVLLLAWYSILIWQNKNYLDLFDHLNGIIEISKVSSRN